MLSENFSTITSPPILLRVLLLRKIVCILNYYASVLFLSQCKAESRNKSANFAVILTLSSSSPRLELRVGLRSRILSLRVCLQSRVIYKFSCAGCSACSVGETKRHVATRIREHLSSDKHSHVFKHLRVSENCRSFCSKDYFKTLDSASTSFQLKIKEAMHILWEQPPLNFHVKHLNLSLSY